MSSTPAPKSKKPCSYFLKGACAYGEKCPRPHVSSAPSRKNPGPPQAENASPVVASQKPKASSAPSKKNPSPPQAQNASPVVASQKSKASSAPSKKNPGPPQAQDASPAVASQKSKASSAPLKKNPSPPQAQNASPAVASPKSKTSSAPSKKNPGPPRTQNASPAIANPKPQISTTSSSKKARSRRAQNASPAIASPRPQYPAATSILSGSSINRSPTPPDRDTIEQPKPSKAAPRALSQDICHFYPQGLCANGDECEFLHQGAREPSPVADTRSPTPSYPTLPAFSYPAPPTPSYQAPPTPSYPTSPTPPLHVNTLLASPETRVCKLYLKGRCWEGIACEFSHPRDGNDYSPSTRSSSSRFTRDEPPSRVAAAYRPASPFGYESDVIQPRETPPDSEDEDQFADADEEDEEEEISEVHKFIMKTPRAQARALSPQRRVYPVVASPKPVPYVTEIVPHWSQFADPKADGNVPFCKQLAQNQCVLGDECRFRHSLTIDEYAMLFKDQQPNMWTISRVEKPHQAVSSPPTTMIVSPSPVASIAPVAHTTTKAVAAKPSSKRPVVEKKPCNFWTLGKCKNGTKCPFAHIGTPPPAEDTSHKSTTICRNLQVDGECKYGAACFYSHDLSSTSEAQEQQQQDEGSWGITTNENGWGPPTSNSGWEEDDTTKAVEQADNSWGAAPAGHSSWGSTHDSGRNATGDSGWGSSRDSGRNGGWSGSGSSSNLRTGSRPGSGVCFDYTQGRCRRGDACRFAHDQESSGDSGHHSGRDSGWSGMFSVEARARRGPCYDHQQGGCNRGDHCRFSHDDGPAEKEPTSNQSGWDGQPAGSTAHESWGEPESKGEEEDGAWAEEDEGQSTQPEGAGGWAEETEGQFTQPEGAGGWAEETEGQFTQPEGAGGWADDDEGQPIQPEGAADGEEGDEADGWEAEPEGEVENLDESWTEQATEGASGWGDVSVAKEDGETAKIQRPCKAFGQGICARGDDCWYLHELPEDQVQYYRERNPETDVAAVEEQVEEARADGEEAPQQLEDVAADGPTEVEEPASESDVEPELDVDLERLMYHCTVRFNSRCSPTAVMTAADSCKIILSNLPADSKIAEIKSLALRFGVVKDVSFLGEATDSATVSIEFAKPEDAMAAVTQLNEQPFGSRPISAKLDSRAPVFARSPLHSQMLMISWPGPTLVAWAYYPTITIAKAAAAKLDKTMFMGRKIGAIFDRPGKKGPFPIRLTSLPPGATKGDLDSFCDNPAPSLTTLGEPSYTESPEELIRKDLRKYGRIEDFNICAQDDGTFRTVAYVTMQTYTAADEAATALNKATPQYLGQAVLKVQHIYLASYKVLPEIFECIRDRVGVIREKHKDTCTIVEDFDGYSHAVELRASIDQSKEFAEANVELGELIDGSVILNEEQDRLWDPYLYLPSSAKAIDKINNPSSDVPCFVHCDKRLQCVRVYGSLDGQTRGKKTLLKILKKVAEQCHEISLDRKAHIAGLVAGGFVKLQTTLGENKISLSLVEAKLTIRGSADDLETAKGVVSDLASSPSPSSSDPVGTNICPFCERVPKSPVKLTCRHAYCQACLQFALRLTATRDTTPRSPFFACIAPLRACGKPQDVAVNGDSDGVVQRCNAPLSYVVVRDILSTAQEMYYLKAAFLASVRASAGRFFFCPTPDCSTVHRAGEEGIVSSTPRSIRRLRSSKLEWDLTIAKLFETNDLPSESQKFYIERQLQELQDEYQGLTGRGHEGNEDSAQNSGKDAHLIVQQCHDRIRHLKALLSSVRAIPAEVLQNIFFLVVISTWTHSTLGRKRRWNEIVMTRKHSSPSVTMIRTPVMASADSALRRLYISRSASLPLHFRLRIRTIDWETRRKDVIARIALATSHYTNLRSEIVGWPWVAEKLLSQPIGLPISPDDAVEDAMVALVGEVQAGVKDYLETKQREETSSVAGYSRICRELNKTLERLEGLSLKGSKAITSWIMSKQQDIRGQGTTRFVHNLARENF